MNGNCTLSALRYGHRNRRYVNNLKKIKTGITCDVGTASTSFSYGQVVRFYTSMPSLRSDRVTVKAECSVEV